MLVTLAVLGGASAAVALEAQRRLLAAQALEADVRTAGQGAPIERQASGDALPGEDPAAGAVSARALLAEAIRLSGENDTDAAERAFAAVLRRSDDPAVLRDARFDLANLYLRAGLRPELEPARAAALVEIAKQRYRDHLRDDPDDMDARWNLERALRAAPEGEDAIDPGTAPPVKRVNVIVPDFAPTDLP